MISRLCSPNARRADVANLTFVPRIKPLAYRGSRGYADAPLSGYPPVTAWRPAAINSRV